METTVAALLLVTASVVLACVVINYAIDIVQVTINPPAEQLSPLQNYINNKLNQTNNLFNEYVPELPSDLLP
jgi:hypothetical protein